MSNTPRTEIAERENSYRDMRAMELEHSELHNALKNIVAMWDFLGPAVEQHFASKVERALDAAHAAIAKTNGNAK